MIFSFTKQPDFKKLFFLPFKILQLPHMWHICRNHPHFREKELPQQQHTTSRQLMPNPVVLLSAGDSLTLFNDIDFRQDEMNNL